MGLNTGSGTGIALPGSASLIPPGASNFEDDFPYQAAGTTFGRWTVTQSNGTAIGNLGSSNEQGILQIQAGVVANARYAVSRGLGQFIIPNVFWQFNIGLSIPVLSVAGDRYTIRAGLMDTAGAAAPANGVWFDYSDNLSSAQWQLNVAHAGATTTQASGAFVTTGLVSLKAYGFSNTSAVFNINGSNLGQLDGANFPTGDTLGLVIGIFNSSATVQHNLLIDYAALYYNVSR